MGFFAEVAIAGEEPSQLPTHFSPRCYTSSFDCVDSFQLCGFCDTSSSAYAAVIFLFLRTGTEWTAKIVASKSRIAPLKPQTIPRLELIGALLLARLLVSVTKDFCSELPLDSPVYYTDSQIALFLLKCVNKDWKALVYNHVEEIRKLVPVEHWYYCPGTENPADVTSRGMIPMELRSHTLWWKGPRWLGSKEKKIMEFVDVPLASMV
uniref:Uncharacterized protein n=1 Tax=Amphimedon queenslandica TaxID=400682 RepID=A0A1X7URR0_AMPQE